MPFATLQAIQDKTRRLTRTPSENQLSTTQLNDYINNFLLYDVPSELRLFSQRTTFDWYTQPFVDSYDTNTTDDTSPLFNFQNKYMTLHPQVFMAGIPATFTQYRDIFYMQWPQTNAVVNTGLLGNGTTGPFQGIVDEAQTTVTPGIPQQPYILQKSVIFTALDTNNIAMVMIDLPRLSNPLIGDLYPANDFTISFGTVNYQTGVFDFNFPRNTMVSSSSIPNPVWVEYVPFVPGKPIAMLYFNNIFTIRPVPDKAYLIQMEADVRPTELINSSDVPELEEWWQFIAIGAAKRIFEDRMDLDSVAQILPMYNDQLCFVNRVNLVQQANMRTQTIYTMDRRNVWGWQGSNWPF